MGDTVLVHDLCSTELQVGSVDFTTEQLVDSRSTRQDNGLALDLDGSVSKTDEVSTDTDGTASDQGDGEDIFVSPRGSTSDETRALETFNTQTIVGTDDSGDLVAFFTVIVDELRDHFLLLLGVELLLDLRSQVEVLEAGLGPLGVVPRNVEEGNQLVSHTDTGTRVGGQVDAGNAQLPGKLRALVEELVFQRTE